MRKFFSPEYRLKSKSDFNDLRDGHRLHVKGLHFVYRTSTLLHARLGLAVSRKFGNAVKRNRLKRVLRDTFRQHGIRSLPIDILVYPSVDATSELDFPRLMSDGLDKIAKVKNDR